MKVRLETIQLLEGNVSGKCLEIGLGDDSVDLTPKAKATEAKTSKCGYIKLKTFCRVKKANKMKRQPSEWGKKLLANHVSDELKTNLGSILKSRDITLPTKVRLVKAMVFPVVTYGCESWTIKKAESQRINAFELWCWRRLLRVP